MAASDVFDPFGEMRVIGTQGVFCSEFFRDGQFVFGAVNRDDRTISQQVE
jgi:hypothetical protein